MIIASRLFMAMGLFGLIAGTIYYVANPHNRELAGVGLLGAFFAACLTSASCCGRPARPTAAGCRSPTPGWPVRPTRSGAPPTSTATSTTWPPPGRRWSTRWPPPSCSAGSSSPASGSPPSAPGSIGLGLALFLGATVIWYRNVAVDRGPAWPHGGPTGEEHGIAVHPEVPEVDTSPVGPANYFEQLREAMEVGDAAWAAAAYLDAVYYERQPATRAARPSRPISTTSSRATAASRSTSSGWASTATAPSSSGPGRSRTAAAASPTSPAPPCSRSARPASCTTATTCRPGHGRARAA